MWLTGSAPHVDTRVVPMPGNSGNNTPPVYVPFTSALTFTENKQMFRRQATGVSAFTATAIGASDSVAGTTVDVELVTIGTTPTFPAHLKKVTASSNYATTNGVVNYIRFWHTGSDIVYAIWQNNPSNIPFAPYMNTATLPSPYSLVTLTFSLPISSVGPPSAFVVTFNGGGSQTASSASAPGGSVVHLVFNPPLTSAVSPKLTTTNARILSSDGEYAGDVVDFTVAKT